MSDFLTHLVTRSFTPAPDVVRPKLPSLFEVPGGSEPVLEASAGINAREELVETTPDSPVVNQPRLESYRVNENQRSSLPQTEPGREAYARRQTILPFVPEELPRAPVTIQGEERIVAAPGIRAEESHDERKPLISPRVEAVTQSARENNKSESVRGVSSHLIPVIPKLESHPLPQTENSDAKIFSLDDRSPTVRIHIGRIEVRAVTQSTPPARAVVPNRPKMTLDDYLLRRNEGKR